MSHTATPVTDISSDVTPDATTGSFVCARRQVLLGASVGGVALVAAACGGSSSKAATAPTTAANSSAAGTATTTAPASGAGSAAAATGFIALSKIPSDTSISVKDPTGRILLMTQSGGKLTALSSVCTHQGCTVAPSGKKLECPCHGSEFSLTGAVEQGPATVALHTVAVTVSGGQVSLA